MASQRQTPAETASGHQEPDKTSKKSILTSLDDALLAYIISFLRWGPRRQLRAVCHRLKALVDQQVTKVEMDLTLFSEEANFLLVKKAALLWPGTLSVLLKSGNKEGVSPAIVEALASCEWPKLQIIKFWDLSSDIACAEALASARGWPALRELHLSNRWDGDGLSTAGIEAISKGLHWPKLEVLIIGSVALGLKGGPLLASLSHSMPALRSLCLRDSNMRDANIEDFCEGSWPSLEILDLTSKNLGPESGAILAEASKKWVKLCELDLYYNILGTNGLEHLLQGDWPCLEKLKLGQNELDDRAGALLADASLRLPCMRELNVSGNELRDSGICALLEGQWPLLESLGIRNTRAGMGALSALAAASVRCPNIRELCLGTFEGLDIGGVHALARGTWNSVTNLDVSSCSRRGSRGVVAHKLAEIMSPHLPSLKELCLTWCDLYDSGLKEFLRGQWRSLEILHLTGNRLTNASAVLLAEASLNVLSGIKCLNLVMNLQLKDAGIKSLMKGNWSNMETLIISNTGMEGSTGAEAVAAAASRLPSLRVLRLEGNDIDEAGAMALVNADWSVMDMLSMRAPTQFTDELQQRDAVVQQMKAAANRGGFKLHLL